MSAIPATKPTSRKLKVVNVVEAAPAPNTAALVDQLIETTTAPIQNYTEAALPEKKPRKPRAPRATATDEPMVTDEATDERKPRRSTVTDEAQVTDEAADAVVSKRKYTRKPKADAAEDATQEKPKRKPRATKTAVEPAPAPLSVQMPLSDPFSPSETAMPTESATHEDVDVEECSINGTLYYRDARGQLYDHTTFARVSI